MNPTQRPTNNQAGGVSLRRRPTTVYENQQNPNYNNQPSSNNSRSNYQNNQPGYAGSSPRPTPKKPPGSSTNRRPQPPSLDQDGKPSTDRRRPRKDGQPEKSKISAALLNKRQSVSYGLRSLKSSQPVPPIPALPTGALGGGGGTRKYDDRIGGKSQLVRTLGLNIDIDTLSQETFDPESFIKIHLSISEGGSSDPDALRSFKNSLKATRLATNQELQENAYKNYSAFVAISKEMATLENEMLELKSALEEFKVLPNELSMGIRNFDDNFTNDIRKRSGRNSVADVNALYKAQLEQLWENVEGSQKFLPIKPGRHIVYENKNFVELNPLTFQPKQPVYVFLLSDSILLAIRRRTGMGGGTAGKLKLMAEKCFQLVQVSIVDLSNSADLTNAVQIKGSRETVVLRTDRNEDKRELLNSLRKIAEDMSNQKRKQSMIQAERRRPSGSSDRFADYPSGYTEDFQITSSPIMGINPSEVLGFGKNDPTGRDLSWIGDLSDELSMTISCRKFEETVEILDRAKILMVQLSLNNQNKNSRTSNSNLSNHGAIENFESHSDLNSNHPYMVLKSKVEEKSQELVNKLLKDLLQPSLKKSELVKASTLINRLNNSNNNTRLSTATDSNNYENDNTSSSSSLNEGKNNGSNSINLIGQNQIEKAKQNFLIMRSGLVKQQTRKIKFEGDLLLWVSQSAFVFFTLVKNTCEWYMTAFRDNQVASGFVRWAVDQIELYGEMFRKQVYGGKEDQGENEQDRIEAGLGLGDELEGGNLFRVPIAIAQAHAGMLKEVGLNFSFLLEIVLKNPKDLISNKMRFSNINDNGDEPNNLTGRRNRRSSYFKSNSHFNNSGNSGFRRRSSLDGT